jgi:zinc-binding alcohol dehydrogenase family protein
MGKPGDGFGPHRARAGTVEAVGSEISLFKLGYEVFYSGAMDRPGTNAEFHLVDERIVGPKPKTLSFGEAAALPLTSITAWEMLFDRMRVPYGSKKPCGALLVVNGAGGVGSIMIQFVARLTALTVIATASRPETTEWVRKLGASHVADHSRPLDEAIKAIGFNGVDYVAANQGVFPASSQRSSRRGTSRSSITSTRASCRSRRRVSLFPGR